MYNPTGTTVPAAVESNSFLKQGSPRDMVFFITKKFQLIFSPNVFSLSLQLPDPSAPQPVGLKSPLLSEFPPLILCVGNNKTIAEFSFC